MAPLLAVGVRQWIDDLAAQAAGTGRAAGARGAGAGGATGTDPRRRTGRRGAALDPRTAAGDAGRPRAARGLASRAPRLRGGADAGPGAADRRRPAGDYGWPRPPRTPRCGSRWRSGRRATGRRAGPQGPAELVARGMRALTAGLPELDDPREVTDGRADRRTDGAPRPPSPPLPRPPLRPIAGDRYPPERPVGGRIPPSGDHGGPARRHRRAAFGLAAHHESHPPHNSIDSFTPLLTAFLYRLKVIAPSCVRGALGPDSRPVSAPSSKGVFVMRYITGAVALGAALVLGALATTAQRRRTGAARADRRALRPDGTGADRRPGREPRDATVQRAVTLSCMPGGRRQPPEPESRLRPTARGGR